MNGFTLAYVNTLSIGLKYFHSGMKLSVNDHKILQKAQNGHKWSQSTTDTSANAQ